MSSDKIFILLVFFSFNVFSKNNKIDKDTTKIERIKLNETKNLSVEIQ